MSNRRALMLSSVMMRGYGVSVVAHEIAKRMGPYGWDLDVGSVLLDETYRGEGVFELGADPSEILVFCAAEGIEAVIAQTTPYFEALPALSNELPTVVFEHGDPSPSFFDEDSTEREQIRQHKISNVYPVVSRVLTSSHFLRHDIEWLSSQVVPLGCDHVPDLGPKDLSLTAHRRARPLRVGTLMRLGEGESKYKGVDLYAGMVERLRKVERIEFAIMGRGNDSDRVRWEALGVEVFLNASDEERARYLRDLDVLISPSMWEGFNLPLVEAQASGTVGLAFDVGAHPETTPFVVSSVDDAAHLLRVWSRDRDQLAKVSRSAYRFAREKFSWETSAKLLASHLNDVAPAPLSPAPLVMPGRVSSSVVRVERLVRREGIVGATRVIGQQATSRLRPH